MPGFPFSGIFATRANAGGQQLPARAMPGPAAEDREEDRQRATGNSASRPLDVGLDSKWCPRWCEMQVQDA